MKTKSFSEIRNEEPFNWNIFLEDVKTRDISKEEHSIISKKANSWVTCACGNLCSIIPRAIDGSPKDQELLQLGYDFAEDIDKKYWLRAQTTLIEIESRSAILISKMQIAKQQNIKKKLSK